MNGKTISAGSLLVMLAALLGVTSCRTVKPLPPVDLSGPGWHVLQGQALWKPDQNRPEVPADLLLATNATGDFYVQLTKDPFPLANAEVFHGGWQIRFGAGQYIRRGRGVPPQRFALFQLPRALLGDRPSGDWRFEKLEPNAWRLDNPRTGEILEARFFP